MSITWTSSINRAAAPTKNPVVFMFNDIEGVVAKKANSLPIAATKNKQKVVVVTVFKALFSFRKAEAGDRGRRMGLQSGSFSEFPIASSPPPEL